MIELNLNGTWEMRARGEERWIPAVVPGSVYEDLLREGEIQDPFYRDHEAGAKAVSEKDYDYRRRFLVSPELLSMDSIQLECQGIDTIADIHINGILVRHCENMHMVLEAEVKAALRMGENEITVSFTSPYRQIENIKAKHPYMDLDRHLFQAKMQMRKAACMFGWDWGPELADMGIWSPISLKGYRAGRIQELQIRQNHRFGKVELVCDIEWETFLPDTKCGISILSPEGEVLCEEAAVDGHLTCMIENPRLWWCINYGEQPRYIVCAKLWHENEIVHMLEKKIGLRTLTVKQEKDCFGETFHFVINDVEVFAKGADYIPEDSLFGRMREEKSRQLIDSCIKANFNMIRIWGGGVYPAEAFLDYCDQTGIMVWQDFMFANIVTIWEGDERANMEAEVVQLTRRLRHHPCIALLCGNNETELMVWDTMEQKYKDMYVQQFEVDMKALVSKEAPDIFYWPSSPSSSGSMQDVENMDIGDTHDWNVWHGQKPFTYFRTTFPRFNSEFGLQSFPCMKTIESFTLPEDRNIFSYVMEGHQKSKNGNEVINAYIAQYFKFPKDFASFVYLSQMIQLEGIRYGVEHWRRNRNDCRCMGALFWQINDCWPVASWASIDCFGRWKALQYGAKRFFEPVLVSACEEGTKVELHLTNETLVKVQGTLKWQLRHVERGLIKEGEFLCSVERLHSECIKVIDFQEELQQEEDYRRYYAAYVFTMEEKIIGSGTVIFKPAKHFDFQKPEIHCEKLDGNTYRITAGQFCKFVEISFQEDLLLSDNYFDLVPGMEKIITTDRQTREIPVITSLYDSYD